MLTKREKIIGVIRGELPLSLLSDIGIKISQENGVNTLESSLSEPIVSPQISDIIKGILTVKSNPSDFKKWAFFILAENIIDLSEIEDLPFGEDIIEALWDASDSGYVSSIFEKSLKDDDFEEFIDD